MDGIEILVCTVLALGSWLIFDRYVVEECSYEMITEKNVDSIDIQVSMDGIYHKIGRNKYARCEQYESSIFFKKENIAELTVDSLAINDSIVPKSTWEYKFTNSNTGMISTLANKYVIVPRGDFSIRIFTRINDKPRDIIVKMKYHFKKKWGSKLFSNLMSV